MTEIQPAPADWRITYARSRTLAWCELLFLLALTSTQFLGFGIQISPTLMVLGWLSLILRRVGWKGIGLGRPALGWSRTVAWSLLGAAVCVVLGTWVVDPLTARLTGQLPDVSSFRPLVGNWRLLLVYLTVAWTFAAFGEEIIYRGYLCNRLTDALGNNRRAQLLAVFLSSLLFGSLHSYQGTAGMVGTGFSGLIFGLAYYFSGRNLWVAVLIHGIYDTAGIVMMYFGIFPGI